MRIRVTKPANLFFMLVIVVTACTKADIKKPPVSPTPPDETPTGPAQPSKTGTFRFLPAGDLTGQPYHSSNLRAVVSITKANGAPVVQEQIVTLDLSAPVKTSVLELPAGDYKLTAFRMEYGSVNTHFAAPMAGSAKAAAVQKPLSIDFEVKENSVKDIAVEVLRVLQGETPQQYGYPSGAFDHGQEDANPYMKVKIKAVMKIGEVVYDSIPAALRITMWNDKGEMTTNYSPLAAGVNEIQLLKSASKFEFLVSKWGTNDAITLEKKDVDLSTVYVLGGSKTAKKLKSERTYQQGNTQADTKTDYFYDHLGNLLKVDYWMRKEDHTPYLGMIDWFEYSNDRLVKIKRVDPSRNITLSETTFTCNSQGKITGIAQNESGVVTTAAVAYYPTTQEMSIGYEYPGRTFSMNYNAKFYNGNMISSLAVTTNHNSELGRYGYDFNINPYRHMNWPNLFLSNSSKNNMTYQSKEYSGSYPVAEPYSFVYTYDADGYPAEVVKNFKSYLTGAFLFSTKTVFVY
jgi:hypothetical protein